MFKKKSAVTAVLLGSLVISAPVISYAGHNGPGTMIETRPYESDEHITDTVKHLIAEDKELEKRDIKVKTTHAIVIMTGTVKSKEESGRAYVIAKRLPEVDKVRNQLKIATD